MADRNTFHKLLDSLPDGALEAAEEILRSAQTGKVPFRQSVQQMRRNVRRRMALPPPVPPMEHLQKRGLPMPSRDDLDANRYASGVAWEGETRVIFKIMRIHRQELQIEERFSISEDKSKLRYSHQVLGAKGKKDTFEIGFKCT